MASLPKVIIIAYECSPAKGHAPGAAWQYIVRLASNYNLYVITEEEQYKQDICNYIASKPLDNIKFHFIRSHAKTYKGKRPVLPIRSMLRYRRWLKSAAELAKKINDEESVILIHHLRGNSFREPGYSWQLGLPYIWGPTGGLSTVPLKLYSLMKLSDKIQHSFRSMLNLFQLHFSKSVSQCLSATSVLIAQTTSDAKKFKKVYPGKIAVIHEQCCHLGLSSLRNFNGQGLLKLLWAGQCIGRKGFPLLYKALKLSGVAHKVQMHIAGDGPLLNEWKNIVRKNDLSDIFVWHGWLSQAQISDLMKHCHALIFTSLLEGTPATVMEAISTGLPVICLDRCGFGDVVDVNCGIKIGADNEIDAVIGFSNAIRNLVLEPGLVNKLSEGAMNVTIPQHNWDISAKKIEEIYNTIINKENK